ncbi:MAG: hypothetical protein ACXQT3_02965 [Methermicoccaceae archaeon]
MNATYPNTSRNLHTLKNVEVFEVGEPTLPEGGVGVRVWECPGDEDCYGEGGCSLLFEQGELPAPPSEIAAHPERFRVVERVNTYTHETEYELVREEVEA